MLFYLLNCEMVITDSGGLQKESFFAKKKCLIVRDQTEWCELIKSRVNFLTTPHQIFDYYKKLKKTDADFSVNPFGTGKASDVIVKSIVKYFN